MPAIQLFRQALRDCQVSDEVVAQIMEGYEDVTDNSKKPKKAAFMTQAMQRMDALLDPAVSHAVRDACACSKGGWRLKAGASRGIDLFQPVLQPGDIFITGL